MLGKLFGSKSRVEILKFFLFHPGEKYYIRQIARDLDLQLNSVRRELENLEQFGLLMVDTSMRSEEIEAADAMASQGGGGGNEVLRGDRPIKKRRTQKKDSGNKTEKKYYRVNTNFILYEELKSLIVKAQTMYKNDFIEKLKGIGKLRLLVLTGFFVHRDNMPVDLLIVGKVIKADLDRVMSQIEKDLGREVNFTVMDYREFKYRRDITDVFLYDILEGKKIVVVDDDVNV